MWVCVCVWQGTRLHEILLCNVVSTGHDLLHDAWVHDLLQAAHRFRGLTGLSWTC